MRASRIPLSFGVLLIVLGVVTFAGVGVSVVLHRLIFIPILVGAELVVGVLFVLVTFPKWHAELEAAARAELPESPTEAASPTAPSGASSPTVPVPEPIPFDPVDQEPNYDPVADADEQGSL